jgi:polysaccharide deacetylase family protein (PEP-CTERM system associated)
MLDDASVRATWFVVGWVAERHPRLIEEIRAAGHAVGCHGYAHVRAYDLGHQRFEDDVRAGVRALIAAGVRTVTAFRAPEWSVNERAPWALQTLVEQGFTHDASMAPLRLVGDVGYPRYPHIRKTAAGPIVEVPPLVADRFGQVMPMGWGWGLRMSSPQRVLRAIEASNRIGLPAVLTVHPWELDPDPPRTALGPRLWFAHYFRLQGFGDRLREILDGASFGCLEHVQAAGEHP